MASGGVQVNGATLREIRVRAGMRQADVAGILGVTRSTVSNMEADRQAISAKQVRSLADVLPEWAVALLRTGGTAEPDIDNASFAIEELTIAYVFETSRSPSEIIQIRRVRAVRAGVSRYALGLVRSDGESFVTDTKVLWGGFLDESHRETDGQSVIAVNFGRKLRRGEVHEIATRSWVERDAEPDTEIALTVTIPTARASIHLAFHGVRGVRRAWSYAADDVDPEQTPVPVGLDSGVTLKIEEPTPGRTYLLAWEW
ncbi:helix-turn-helix transcriptional regulator [Microbacterium sp. DT81.1]|uniref:helix-turn-helix transcriptional regulator n=1 Tax=Microbacterium sp. DT81.1 TaxID=3393413 RepID=UPI003CF3F365